MMDQKDSDSLARPTPAAPSRLSNMLVRCLAGAVGGVVARVTTELSLTILILEVSVILAGILDRPLATSSEATIGYILVICSAMLGGLLGGFTASGTCNRILAQHAVDARRWRWAWIVAGLMVWSTTALTGWFQFGDAALPVAPHPLPSLLLWPISGTIIGVLAGLLVCRDTRRGTT